MWLQRLKDWMLILSIVAGIVFHTWLEPFYFLLPYLIFFMLLVTFSRISPREIKLTKLHGILFASQIIICLLVYWLFRLYSEEVAQSIFICVLAPTATAAAVITGMLGGNIAFLTSYVLVSNVGISLAAPVFFSFIGNNQGEPFFTSVADIGLKVMPILVLPLFLAWILKFITPSIHGWLRRNTIISLYLWSISLVIVIGSTVKRLIEMSKSDYYLELIISGLTLFICLFQFAYGKFIGSRYQETIAAGQAVGQKNTVIAIWMAQIYLLPAASIGPIIYIIWQNIVNSIQILIKKKK